MSNLETWERFADIDPKFTKPITGKQYKGTSPNPQYVIRCLTELFGPVGDGFGWEVLREDFTPIGEEILHWCRIRFWHGKRENCFESYGQTKALMKTKNGMMMDEDAPKKSLTDAIVKAASHVGIAANIFLGRWDDQKYVQTVADEYRKQEEANQPKPDHSQHFDRLSACDTLAELAHVWKGLSRDLQRVPEILTAKDARKAELQAEAEHDKAVKDDLGGDGINY
jgi:hypothetical protein